MQILAVHSAKLTTKLERKSLIRRLAYLTPGFTGTFLRKMTV
jgi:hypothetical protein